MAYNTIPHSSLGRKNHLTKAHFKQESEILTNKHL